MAHPCAALAACCQPAALLVGQGIHHLNEEVVALQGKGGEGGRKP